MSLRDGLSRRDALAGTIAIGIGISAAHAAAPSRVRWREARLRYPQGVASGDPDHSSIILWTRWEPPQPGAAATLTLELAEDSDFQSVIASKRANVDKRSDWTCRVVVEGLKPSTHYFYRFTDGQGEGSRIGRTRTAPEETSSTLARFAFVSCQNANMGPLTPWRRMIFDDVAKHEQARIEFVLHLGDFVYETVWLPEDRPKGYFDRKLRHIVDYPDGERHDDYRSPTSLRDYRALYRAYLLDPDLQDARARWPFICIWDNGEYSDLGWQGMERFGGTTIPAQTRKVAANQAWFEYIPTRAQTIDGNLDLFAAPKVRDTAVTRFDPNGLGLEPNNLAAINSLIAYRNVRWGSNVEIFLTDQRTFRSEDYTAAPEAKAMASAAFPQLVPFESLQAIDAGRTANGGEPPEILRFAEGDVRNWRASSPPRTLLGATQKRWLLDGLSSSRATWKIWANTVATLDMRVDPQNLPTGLIKTWGGKGYAGFARTDHSTAFVERGEIYDKVEANRVDGFVTLSGDRHSFWAGYAAKDLPPSNFRPVGLAFVVGSINSPGFAEALEHNFPHDHPLRPLYMADRADGSKPEPAINLLLRHGVRTCLDYHQHKDLERAKLFSNPGNAPHVDFVDMGGHGFAIVSADRRRIDVEFVCVPRPIADDSSVDGGPIRYRISFGAERWKVGVDPLLRRTALRGDAGLSV